MKWSLKVARVAGIGIYLHWTFLALLGWIAFDQIAVGQFLVGVEAMLFVLALFGCVVLHELGHALVARRYGIRTRDITLLPIGGVARLERIPRDPTQELLVALAGPGVNVALALVIFAGISLGGRLVSFEAIAFTGGPFWAKLLYVNIAMALFNMLPAFPMDGGRVLRALLARRWEHVRATHIAARVGQVIAVALAVFGLLFNWFMVFIAIFVYLAARDEVTSADVRAALAGVPVRRAMLQRFVVLDASAPLQQAAEEIFASGQQYFPVVADGQLVGMLSREKLIGGVLRGRGAAAVGDSMERSAEAVDENAMLDETFERMQSAEREALPVLRGTQLIGVVTLDYIGEWVTLHPTRGGALKMAALAPR